LGNPSERNDIDREFILVHQALGLSGRVEFPRAYQSLLQSLELVPIGDKHADIDINRGSRRVNVMRMLKKDIVNKLDIMAKIY